MTISPRLGGGEIQSATALRERGNGGGHDLPKPQSAAALGGGGMEEDATCPQDNRLLGTTIADAQ